MIFRLLKRMAAYDGRMGYRQESDEEVFSSYQHTYVVERFKEYFEGKEVLDAGCWTGPLERALDELAVRTSVRGIDDNVDALEAARKSFSQYTFEHCNLLCPSESILREWTGRFDTVLFLDVIEHLPKGTEVAVLNVLRGLLKEGGALIMSTMADHMLNIIDPAWMVGHRHYKVKTIKRFLDESGFEAKEILEIGNLYWDIDLLLFYGYKHILGKRYQRGQWISRQIGRGYKGSRNPTRIYLLAHKV